VAASRTLEERLAAVEATTGLAELKSSLIKWVLFSAAGVLVGILSLVFTLNNATNSRIDQTNVKIDSAVAELRTEMNTRFDQTNARLDQLQSETNARFDQMNTRIDQTNARLDQINQRLDRLFELVASQGAARSVRD